MNPKPQSSVVLLTSRALDCFDDDLVAAGIAHRIPLDNKGQSIPTNADGRPVRTPAKWRIIKTDSRGRTMDLHALRHTCGTRLVASGADIKTVQSIMRHASAAFTLSVYVHKDRTRMTTAVANLPELNPSVNVVGLDTRNAAAGA